MSTAPRLLLVTLGAVNIALCAVIAAELRSALPDEAILAAESPADAAPAAAPHAAERDLGRLEQTILERPIFSPDRRPAAATSAEGAADGAKASDLPGRLAGVTIGNNVREAIFMHEGEKPVAVQQGGRIGAWTVKTIDMDRVVLTSTLGERSVEVQNGPATAVRAAAQPSPFPPNAPPGMAPRPPAMPQLPAGVPRPGAPGPGPNAGPGNVPRLPAFPTPPALQQRVGQ